MRRRMSLKQSFYRHKSRPTNSPNIVTLSSLGKDISELKKELIQIRHMIEIQTEITERLLNWYKESMKNTKNFQTIIIEKS